MGTASFTVTVVLDTAEEWWEYTATQNSLLPISPADWVNASSCGPSHPDCKNVVFPENGILVFEKHREQGGAPADLWKVEIFIDKDDDNGQTEIFSRWNLPARIDSVNASCVGGMTMYGNEYG